MSDSDVETARHIRRVQELMAAIIAELARRMAIHDKTKLETPEREMFEVCTSRLKGMTYGSEEYKKCLTEMGPALKHHYENNPHHPEHFPTGMDDMDLVDLIEMICDWKAATERHADGDIMKSIEINRDRFHYGCELARLLGRTVKRRFES